MLLLLLLLANISLAVCHCPFKSASSYGVIEARFVAVFLGRHASPATLLSQLEKASTALAHSMCVRGRCCHPLLLSHSPSGLLAAVRRNAMHCLLRCCC